MRHFGDATFSHMRLHFRDIIGADNKEGRQKDYK